VVASQPKETTLNNAYNNQLTIMNQILGVRLKTVNLSSFLSKRRENDTLYVENSVDAKIKEVYQLSTYTVEYKERTSTQTM
jgi:hypothetical protein